MISQLIRSMERHGKQGINHQTRRHIYHIQKKIKFDLAIMHHAKLKKRSIFVR